MLNTIRIKKIPKNFQTPLAVVTMVLAWMAMINRLSPIRSSPNTPIRTSVNHDFDPFAAFAVINDSDEVLVNHVPSPLTAGQGWQVLFNQSQKSSKRRQPLMKERKLENIILL